MKKVFLLASLCIGLLFSCSSDDDASSENNSPIVGEWSYVSFTDIETGEVEPADACDVKDVLTFRADLTFTSIAFSDNGDLNADGTIGCDETNISGTYSIDNNKLNFETNSNDIDDSPIEFKLEGNNLSIISSDGTTLYKRK